MLPVMRTNYRTQRPRAGAAYARQLFHQCAWALRKPFPAFTTRLLAQLLILGSLILMPRLCSAQEAKDQGRQRRVSGAGEEVALGDVIRIETDLVPVGVIVRDGAGQVVRGLRSSDFRIFEDGVERPISFFGAETTGGPVRYPLDLVFALDVSGSMTPGEMEMLHQAAAVFTARLSGPGSRFAVISFGMKVKILQSFTTDQRKLDKAFDSALRDESGLSTHALDAVDDAVRLLARQGRKTSGDMLVKRVVVVISDGFPVGDTVSPSAVIERANAAHVSVYTVTMPSFSIGFSSAYAKPLPTILDVTGLVEETGGGNAYATNSNYTEALMAISQEVLARYVIAFYPGREKRRDGAFHQLLIIAPEGMTVSQSRQGYVGKGL